MGAEIYKDIAERTGGDVYVGVVGPVRSGKSTFIKRLMETAVIPRIEDENERKRAEDETPQSAAGKTVMTTEPKFVPDEAVKISLPDNTTLRVKAIDCVGFLIPGAIGDTEEGEARMVRTPWSDEPVPFEKAAEEGTRRVIRDHSTVGILVTSDGSFGELPRESFVSAEQKAAAELAASGKPFAVVLNSAEPGSESAEALALDLEEKYGVPVALVNCLDLNEEDLAEILKLVLSEFPLCEIAISFPDWTGALDGGHWLKKIIAEAVSGAVGEGVRACQASSFAADVASRITDTVKNRTGDLVRALASVKKLDAGSGVCEIGVELPDELFYAVIGELTGIEVKGEEDLLSALCSLSRMKREYDKFSAAIDEVTEKGYGIVMPEQDDLTLDEPEIVKQTGGYGLRLRAAAPSIHLIRAGIETELNPIVGTEQQSEELVKYLLDEFKDDPRGIWDTNLFGKSIYELVNEGLHAKLENLPEDAREKFGQTISRVINEGSSGLICIIL
ncbi:MAG: stage IV sporulation protein A [Clostridia bacterium]|nr:stage IV sporulation protein A [Clostridia bacterium]